MKSKQLFLILIIPVSTNAQIATDGTLGQALKLPENTIDTSTKGEGESGNIHIQTQQMSLGEGAAILSNVYDT